MINKKIVWEKYMIISHSPLAISFLLGAVPKDETFVPFDGCSKTGFDVVEGNNVFGYSLC